MVRSFVFFFLWEGGGEPFTRRMTSAHVGKALFSSDLTQDEGARAADGGGARYGHQDCGAEFGIGAPGMCQVFLSGSKPTFWTFYFP